MCFFIFILFRIEFLQANSVDPDQARLIWICTVCLCPEKWALGLYGLGRAASPQPNLNKLPYMQAKVSHLRFPDLTFSATFLWHVFDMI